MPCDVYFLGAGFSAQAGIPVTSTLLNLILNTDPYNYPHKWFLDPGYASRLYHDLLFLINNSQYMSDSNIDKNNIEQILDFLTLAAELDVIINTAANNQSMSAKQLVDGLVWFIVMTIEKTTPVELPSVYSNFAKTLTPEDAIITTNYDVVAERCVLKSMNGVNYNINAINKSGGSEWNANGAFELLKLHGSLNWRMCNGCKNIFVYGSDNFPAHGYSSRRVCEECGRGSLGPIIIPPTH